VPALLLAARWKQAMTPLSPHACSTAATQITNSLVWNILRSAYNRCKEYPGNYTDWMYRCWCGNYLSALSTQLPSSNCSLACVGNDTEICGGYLTLSLYNLTSKKAGSSGSSTKSAAASVAASSWTYLLGAGVMALTLGAAL
jgi:hypothetical protein